MLDHLDFQLGFFQNGLSRLILPFRVQVVPSADARKIARLSTALERFTRAFTALNKQTD
jgi:hypothetical protein